MILKIVGCVSKSIFKLPTTTLLYPFKSQARQTRVNLCGLEHPVHSTHYIKYLSVILILIQLEFCLDAI